MDDYPNVKVCSANQLIIEEEITPKLITPTYFPGILNYNPINNEPQLSEFEAWCSLFNLRDGIKPKPTKEEVVGQLLEPRIFQKTKESIKRDYPSFNILNPGEYYKEIGIPPESQTNYCVRRNDERKWFGGKWDGIGLERGINSMVVETKIKLASLRRYLRNNKNVPFVDLATYNQISFYAWLMEVDLMGVGYGFVEEMEPELVKDIIFDETNTKFHVLCFDKRDYFYTDIVPKLLGWVEKYVKTKISPPAKTSEDWNLFQRVIDNSQRVGLPVSLTNKEMAEIDEFMPRTGKIVIRK